MMTDPAQAWPFVGAFIAPLGDKFPALGFGSFGHHDDAEAASALFPLADAVAYFFDAVGDFRNEDDIASPGHSGMERDPAGVAAHHFTNEHAMVRFGGGVKEVYRIRRQRQG